MTAASEPIVLAHGPAWANRYALAPMTNKQSHPDGILSDDEFEWLVARGRGGFAVTKTCAAYIADTGRTWTGQLGIASDQHLPGLTQRADPALAGHLVAPFDDPATGATQMSREDVDQMVADYVAAAVRAEQAGFDGVEVHGAHGFLLAQFLDRRNQRHDRYGGFLDRRMQALIDVLQGIRSATGNDFQVGVRLSPEAHGTPLDEGREITRQVLTSGVVDVVDMSLRDVFATPHHNDDDFLLIDTFAGLPRGNTALSVAGRVLSAADAAWCLDRGADIVTVGTGAILPHYFAARALTDPDFTARPQPVPREVLQAELVGPPFMDYLAENWRDLVA